MTTYIETTLPSGPTAQMWITENCAVIKVNGRVTYAARAYADHTNTPERLAELAPLLLAAAATEPREPGP